VRGGGALTLDFVAVVALPVGIFMAHVSLWGLGEVLRPLCYCTHTRLHAGPHTPHDLKHGHPGSDASPPEETARQRIEGHKVKCSAQNARRDSKQEHEPLVQRVWGRIEERMVAGVARAGLAARGGLSSGCSRTDDGHNAA